MRNQHTRKLTFLALTISFAMILSFIESRIPAFTAIPGVKVGLANIAVIFTLYKFGVYEAIVVSLLRVVLVSMLFGNPQSFLFSVAGAVKFSGNDPSQKACPSPRGCGECFGRNHAQYRSDYNGVDRSRNKRSSLLSPLPSAIGNVSRHCCRCSVGNTYKKSKA